MAHFSLAFSLALRLTTRASAPDDYVDPGMWSDPDILAATKLVRPYAHEFGDDVPLLCARAEIEMADGRVFSGAQDGFRGSRHVPATREQVLGKFRDNVHGQLSDEDADALLDKIDRIESLDHIVELTRLLARG
jgi:2-methylcitrate dehydratase PrpD